MSILHSLAPEQKLPWLRELAEAVKLREGPDGINKALWILYQDKADSTRTWSRAVHIPVPVLAALRRELEKREILEAGNHLRLTESGRALLQCVYSQSKAPQTLCPTCQGMTRFFPPEIMPVLDEFRVLAEQRPQVDVTLDQSHATPETGIRKALLLLEQGLLAEPLFFLGDDDGISLACHLLRRHFMPDPSLAAPILVADIDTRYLEFVANQSQGCIQTRTYDVRDEFPADLCGQFKAALTDPAYTENGITLFSFRCLSACQPESTLFLSMPLPSPAILRNIQLNILQMGWNIKEILHHFNEYHGASIHAHRSSLLICERGAPAPENSFSLRYTPLYTGDMRTPGGRYQCTVCGTIHHTGPDLEYKTILELKEAGCFECGKSSFHRLGSEANPS
ncbi:MAG: bis-aminopropyl spermidine synthase family protein, partial [bacterium]|nr:bis-aminopropyl spermidine synthase family protein [bacterium]